MPHPQPPGYLAVPPTDERRGLLVLHAWWGLNETMRAVCRRLAAAGFTTFAPDLYRGQIATTIEDAQMLGSQLDKHEAQAKSDIARAVAYLSERGNLAELGVIGFAAGRPVTFHTYPGTGHWFFERDRTGAYNQAAADVAWERTLAFLGSALPSPQRSQSSPQG